MNINQERNNITLRKENWYGPIIFLSLVILTQLTLFYFTNNVYIIVGFNSLLVIVLLMSSYKIRIELQLLILAIIPLIIVNYNFGRSLQYIIIQNATITLFLLLALFQFINKYAPSKNKSERLFVILFIYIIYSIFLCLKGIVNNAPLKFVFNEFYQNFYYFLPIPIYYLIKNRYSYSLLLKTTLIVFIIISIEFFLISFFRGSRFLSFQYLFFPFATGTFFGLIFYAPKNMFHKSFYVICFIIMWIGSVATAARTMWVANLLTILLIVFFYQKYIKKNLKVFILISILIFSVTIPVLLKSDNEKVSSLPTSTTERVESISNPTGDTSFLMRIEASYLAIQKFFQHPVLGEGYGQHIKFKWLLSTQVIYLDNSYLYFLWKGGILGLIIILSVYYVFMKDTLFVIKNSEQKEIKVISIIILSSFTAFLFEGMLSAGMIGFKLNFLYALLFAYVIFEKREILDAQRSHE